MHKCSIQNIPHFLMMGDRDQIKCYNARIYSQQNKST